MTRDEAIEWVESIKEKYIHGGDEAFDDARRKALDMAIEALQDRPKDEWIPCSEKLPENGHYYLWCSDMGNVQSDYYWDGFENGMKYGYNIIAWMPLPKPCR